MRPPAARASPPPPPPRSAAAPAAPAASPDDPEGLYALLGVSQGATPQEASLRRRVRRAFRTARTRAHPDRPGGSAAAFAAVTRAHDVLADPQKRAHYDSTGRIRRGADEAFLESFGEQGAYSDPLRRAHPVAAAAAGASGLGDQIVLRRAEGTAPSHTAGFEAWMRARGQAGGPQVYSGDTVAQEFGVVRGTYEAVPTLPGGAAEAGAAAVPAVVCSAAGASVRKLLALESQPLPPELEFGEVLVVMLAVPVAPGDIATCRLGGVYGTASAGRLPFVAGHDGVGVVARVGPGIKGALCEGDLVQPTGPFAGTWRAAMVCKAAALSRVGRLQDWRAAAGGGGAAAAVLVRQAVEAAAAAGEAAPVGGRAGGAAASKAATSEAGPLLPLEYLAVSRELLTAYRLLEMAPCKPGDCVILNAPLSTVGRTVLQLARVLRLRAIALLRPGARRRPAGEAAAAPPEAAAAAVDDEAEFERDASRLRSLGATHVLRDEGAIRPQLEALGRFEARPVLGLDAVGGDSAARIADALADGATLCIYGCLSGRSPALDWRAFVFRSIAVRGHNARAWAAANPSKAARALRSVGGLVAAGLLVLDFAEYEFLGEWAEGVEGAAGEEGGRCGGSRALLMMPGLPAFAGGGAAEA
ncbi:hypothetical protein Rsub_00377 [Raphidocelis subcapitata]|uniref:J domain-containing protein n=1 Tax=Raphidocelis subcapitata TaxID=307507 RepID=A0A2V0NK60_9CHLO|nr:hypothetical protein Rsub_00377 [Raphidocelis subcapitata]|eukprot:GBF87666.1 hypothetical protein Rsub_00377 [Raphidocelis subcapitata]